MHADEVSDFLTATFDEYARTRDTEALLTALRVVARAKGISALADEIGMSRRGLQKALSGEYPRFQTVYAIVQAMGYRLVPVAATPKDELDCTRGQ